MNLKLSIVNYQLSIFVVLAIFFTLPLKAQVTIGAQKVPHSYSVLELMSTKGGFRLPMLTNDERDALKLTSDSTEASGLVIYNTDIDCVEFWSDGKWIDLCASALPTANINPTTLTTLTPGSGTLKGRTIFDIGVTDGGDSSCGTLANRAPYIVDFSATSVYSYTFTASGMGTVRNVRYMIQDNEDVLQASQSLSGTLVVGTLANGASTQLALTFKPDLNLPTSNPLIVGRDRNAAAKVVIYIIYNNGSTDVKVSLTLSIQDCASGCSVKTTSGTWLTFMCYNLGAADTLQFMSPAQQAAYTNPADGYGDLYQWGRQADGHQLRSAKAVNGGTTSRAIFYDSNSQIPVGDKWYGVPVYFTDGALDWHGNGVDENDHLWDGTYLANNPCPTGWRLPTTHEWLSIVNNVDNGVSIPTTGYTSSSGNTWQWAPFNGYSNPGYLVTPSGSSEAMLFLPAAGYRLHNSGSISMMNVIGYYWSSSPYINTANNVYFTSTQVIPGNSNYRANGFSIRCVAE